MSRADSRAERLAEMERLYCLRGYSDAEMAQRLEVDRSTAFRDRQELERRMPFVQDEAGRWRIDRRSYLSQVRLNLYEALALYLAARRASLQTRIAQPYTAGALEKLAQALRQPMTEKLVRAAETILEQREHPDRVSVMKTLAEAWVQSEKVRIEYLSLHAETARKHVVSPYLIEPSPWTDGVYLIGVHELYGDVVPYRVDRILRAVNTGERFSIPADFDEAALLRHAWGIWSGSREPEMVRLRFAPGTATRRLRESTWHPLEEVEALEGGGCVWQAPIAEWQEMLPWIRGWGADVEVLAPRELREALVREAQKLAALYTVEAITKSTTNYFAHSKPNIPETEWQPLREHLTRTAQIAERLGEDAGISSVAGLGALVHDIGKYSKAFQARLRGAKRHVDHSTAGAREIITLFRNPPHKDFAELLSYCIAGHHSGLPDYGDSTDLPDSTTLLARREKKQLEDYSDYHSEIEMSSLYFEPRQIAPNADYPYFSISFLTRMIFSVLVDADWLETETYMEGETKPRGEYESIELLRDRLDLYLQRYENPKSEINQKRTETLKACIEKADAKPGYFTLTVPTGGGKTLASMAFALHHAVTHGMKRIIYVIPFTSIIEQNAAIFKDILGQENVLEHHSNFDWDQLKNAGNDDETTQLFEKLKLASENWDIPIIVTTNVQFFESLYANKKSRARKLHHIAKSVMIFDEAQMLPREYMRPCMLAVHELVQNYGASAVFCTATQPQLQPFLPDITMVELAPHPQKLFDFYRRVNIRSVGRMSDEDITQCMNKNQQVLCIVNTRRHAKGLFDLLEDHGRFHLSTLMCPAHRKKTLQEIRERLQKEKVCRVVSTQVLEAGVDLDFPVGYRALAGLDSIIQAAGRVNREHRNQSGEVYVFEPQTDFIKRQPSFIKQTAQAAQSVLRDFEHSPDSLEAIKSYFNLLDTLQDPRRSADVKNILFYLNKPGFEFATAAKKFRLIEDPTISVIIPYDETAKTMLQKMRYSPYPASFVRQLQIYTVNLYQREFESLQSKGAIETYQDMYFVLTNMDYYDKHTGIILLSDEGGEAIFFD